MSYDFYMKFDPCQHCGRSDDHFGELNYTYNVWPMFRAAVDSSPKDEDDRKGVYSLQGKTGKECVPLLTDAIERMENAPDIYKEWNPPNGWGTYEGALRVLRTLLDWCIASPKATMVIS